MKVFMMKGTIKTARQVLFESVHVQLPLKTAIFAVLEVFRQTRLEFFVPFIDDEGTSISNPVNDAGVRSRSVHDETIDLFRKPNSAILELEKGQSTGRRSTFGELLNIVGKARSIFIVVFSAAFVGRFLNNGSSRTARQRFSGL